MWFICEELKSTDYRVQPIIEPKTEWRILIINVKKYNDWMTEYTWAPKVLIVKPWIFFFFMNAIFHFWDNFFFGRFRFKFLGNLLIFASYRWRQTMDHVNAQCSIRSHSCLLQFHSINKLLFDRCCYCGRRFHCHFGLLSYFSFFFFSFIVILLIFCYCLLVLSRDLSSVILLIHIFFF